MATSLALTSEREQLRQSLRDAMEQGNTSGLDNSSATTNEQAPAGKQIGSNKSISENDEENGKKQRGKS